jgi:hypothetical protein
VDTAVIWIPADIDPIESAVARCVDHSRRRGYRLEGIVRGPWESVSRMVTNRDVGVVVVPDQAYLSTVPTPRVEVAGH